MGSAATGMQAYAEPREKRFSTIQSSYAPRIPRDLVENCQFLTYTWGTSSRPAANDGSLTLVTLTIDLGIQHSMYVLVEPADVDELMKRALRRITFCHTPDGLEITGVKTDGLGFSEIDGWSIPSSSTH